MNTKVRKFIKCQNKNTANALIMHLNKYPFTQCSINPKVLNLALKISDLKLV